MCIAQRSLAIGLSALIVLSALGVSTADEEPVSADKPEIVLPVIANEPKTVDPAAFIPKPLTKKVTCDLSDSSLNELAIWLREEQKIPTLLDKRALSDVGILPSEPFSDRLDDAPIYFLLNRLRTLDLSWYYKDGILYLTAPEEVEGQTTTVPHNIGDLLDKDVDTESLIYVIESTVSPTDWENVGGVGALSSLGDVLFVRQTDGIQREVQGFLTAIRKHGRMTFVLDPPQHALLREQLDQSISIDFQDTPLQKAVDHFAEELVIDIRLDERALDDVGIRSRQPISVSLTDCKFATALQAMLMELDLTWMIRDGVIWITTPEEAQSAMQVAVFDVRDLCRDFSESEGLLEAITSQASPETWSDVGGPGSIEFVFPGAMVVSHEEKILFDVLELLETYRTALRSSKIRDRDAIDDQEIITTYYRLHADVADDLIVKLPQLVAPGTWHDKDNANAPGRIIRVASSPEILASDVAADGDNSPRGTAFVTSQATLIITQTRETHAEIVRTISRIKFGDGNMGFYPPRMLGGGMGGMGGFGGGMGGFGGGMGGGGMGGGGGSFGGGFFTVPSADHKRPAN